MEGDADHVAPGAHGDPAASQLLGEPGGFGVEQTDVGAAPGGGDLPDALALGAQRFGGAGGEFLDVGAYPRRVGPGDQREPGGGGVAGGDRRGAGLVAARRAGEVEEAGVEGEGVAASEPAGQGRVQVGRLRATRVEESQAGRPSRYLEVPATR